MQTLTYVLPLLLSALNAPEHPAASIEIDQLSKRLAFQDPASYWIEYETHYFPITNAQADKAKEHYVLTRDLCHVEGPNADGLHVSFDGMDTPVGLMNAESQKTIRNSERLDVAWPWFRMETSAESVAGSEGWSTLRVHDTTGLTVWDRDQGVTRDAERLGVDNVWDAEAGAVTLLGRFFRQAALLLEQVDSENSTELRDGGLTARIPMLDPAFLDRFWRFALPNGVMVTPGSCEVEFSNYGTRSRLDLHYRDCLDEDLVTQTMRWEGGDSFPSSYEEIWWVAGTGAMIRHQSVSIARNADVTPTAETLQWRGEPGQRVFDRRFGGLEYYRVGEEHRDDLSVVIAVDAAQNNAKGLMLDTGRAELQTVRGSEHFEVRAPNIPARVMMGTELQLVFEIENTSKGLRTFTLPNPSCGIIDMEFDWEDVRDAQVVPFALDVEVVTPGWNEFTVNIPFLALNEEDCGELEVAFSIFGEDVGSMEPRVQGPIRWIEGEDFPTTSCHWKAGFGRESQPSFQTQPAAAIVETRIANGGAELLVSDLKEARGFGITPIRLQTQAHPEALIAHEALVLINRVPAALQEEWPTCVRAHSGSFPRIDRFEIPGVHIQSARVVKEAGSSVRMSNLDVRVEAGGLELVELAAPGDPSKLLTYQVVLTTSIGEVSLFVYSAPARTEPAH
ncbi:MAG: hypothetical protein ACI8X5_003146 [Planctomycetota bacterium]|jgi:hypothetical protein